MFVFEKKKAVENLLKFYEFYIYIGAAQVKNEKIGLAVILKKKKCTGVTKSNSPRPSLHKLKKKKLKSSL